MCAPRAPSLATLADEHAVYLRFICAFYDNLPKLSIFLHGHHTSWHNRRSPPAADQLRRMNLSAAAAAGNVYRSFNDYDECWRDHDSEWAIEMLAQLHGWRRQMQGALGQPPPLQESYCCTQFVVSADRIRSRPLSFWRQLLADLLDGDVPAVCKVSGHVLELTWGFLLGEPPSARCRRDGWGHTGSRELPAAEHTAHSPGVRSSGTQRVARPPPSGTSSQGRPIGRRRGITGARRSRFDPTVRPGGRGG